VHFHQVRHDFRAQLRLAAGCCRICIPTGVHFALTTYAFRRACFSPVRLPPSSVHISLHRLLLMNPSVSRLEPQALLQQLLFLLISQRSSAVCCRRWLQALLLLQSLPSVSSVAGWPLLLLLLLLPIVPAFGNASHSAAGQALVELWLH